MDTGISRNIIGGWKLHKKITTISGGKENFETNRSNSVEHKKDQEFVELFCGIRDKPLLEPYHVI